MIRLLKYFKWYYWIIVLFIIGFVYIQVSFDLMLPEFMQEVIALIDSKSAVSEIYNVGLKMIGVTLLSLIASIIVGYLASRVASGFARIIRSSIYNKVDSFSLEEINKFSTSSLITRSTNDVQQVQMLVTMFLRLAITAPIMAASAIVKIISVNTTISLVVFSGVVAIVVMISLVFIYVTPKFKKIQTKTDELNLVARENLTGLRVVRAFNAEGYQEEKFEVVNNELTSINLASNRALSFMMPGMQLILNGTILGIFWIGAILISQGLLGTTPIRGLASLMAYSTYGSQIVMSFMFLTFLFIMIPRASVSGKRINEVLNTVNLITDPIISKEPVEVGSVEFINVYFKYPGADGYVLEDISFKVTRGETIAFIGSTGSGKSTIVNLVARFYDVTDGEILVDGVNVKDYKLKDLHNLLGFIPQKGLLFSGDIESNLKMGKPDASEEEMWEALKISQASHFVSSLEDGLKHQITQGGTNVSGGQKQRLCVARAVIRKPEIFVFDDSFSALDYKTDKLLRASLKNMKVKATNMIVATRIGTIMDADIIIVLDNGKIVGQGSHDKLVKENTIYQEIAFSQLSKEELNYE